MVIKFKDHPEFKPDYTPEQMFKKGIFSNGYFRPIYSTVTNKYYKNDYKKYKCLKNVKPELMNRPFTPYNPLLNYYKKKSGLSLEYWEEHNWIRPQDPRGFVNWYCEFTDGRRSPDDTRQIRRFNNIKIRFGKQKNKSDVIKQALLQWGINWK